VKLKVPSQYIPLVLYLAISKSPNENVVWEIRLASQLDRLHGVTASLCGLPAVVLLGALVPFDPKFACANGGRSLLVVVVILRCLCSSSHDRG
jgi:hypothetical protein